MAKGDKLSVVMGREKAVPGGVATLGADGILEESQRPTVPGKNLLINSDFRKPVNRNGKAEYTERWTYSIDRWILHDNSKIAINDGSITVTGSFYQIFENLQDGQYTASVLAADGLHTATAAIAATSSEQDIINLPSVGWAIRDSTGRWQLRIEFGNGPSEMFAAILEEGDHQTHFRQNESGEWELIDPVDYDTQYLLCSQYSPITGEWVGSQHVNENLLDNSYWALLAAIVNQKNKTTYGPFSTSRQFTIDRWFIQSNSAYITLNETDQCLDLHTGTVVSWDGIEQTVDLNRDFIGKQLTLSALLRGEVGKKFCIAARVVDGGFSFRTSLVGTGNWELATLTFTVPENIVNLSVAVAGEATVEDKTISIKACQLELGPISTLAHKEGGTWILNRCRPDYALELMKCQRYQVIPAPQAFYRVRSVTVDTNVLYFHLPISGELRAKPAIVNSDRIQVASIGGSAIPGFSFEVDGYGPGWISVIATKNAHGLADAWLLIMNDFRYGTPVIFDANL